MSDRTLDDVVRALVRSANFGGDVESATVCQEWADQYDADTAPPVPAEEPAPKVPVKK